MIALHNHKRLLIIEAILLSILLIPLLAMQVSAEVNWSGFDFAIMGVMLLILGVGLEITLRVFPKKIQRIWVIGVVLIVFLLIWVELAVGVFGSPIAGS